jgi:hypothetical protein
MLNQIEDQLTSDGNETVNRVVDNLFFVQGSGQQDWSITRKLGELRTQT